MILVCPRCGHKHNTMSFNGNTPLLSADYGVVFRKTMAFALECVACGLRTQWYASQEEAIEEWNGKGTE